MHGIGWRNLEGVGNLMVQGSEPLKNGTLQQLKSKAF